MHYLEYEMATKAKKANTKKDLEAKIAELEAKLNSLSTQLETKPTPKPAETKPAPKPAETAKPKPTLPKGMEEKPAEVPKPAETTAQPPSTVQAALENAYMNAPMTDLHHYRAKTTGYTPAPNRYFVRLTAPVGKVPTTNWNDQKASVTGYTAASNQYFATRARLAYHPADKTFGSFSGVNMSVQGVTEKQAPTPEPPKPKGTLPKGTEQTQQTSPQTSGSEGKSRKQELEEYEKDYMDRIEQDRIQQEKEYQKIIAAEAKSRAQRVRGSLPKGFESAAETEPEPPKPKGTLPKDF